MPTLNVTSSNTPLVIPASDLLEDTIVVSQTGVVTDLTIDVNITAPNEGGGPDPSLISFSINRVDLAKSVTLHGYEALAVNGVNYDTDRDPFDGTGTLEAMFDGVSLNGNWLLGISNVFSTATGTLNSWGINFTYDAIASIPFFVTQPAALTIPTGIKYGKGRSQKLNQKLAFNVQTSFAANDILDVPKVCGLNGVITELRVLAKNTGSSGTTNLTLYKFSGGVLSTLISSNVIMNSGNTYYHRQYNDSALLSVSKNDLLFFKANTVATGLESLSVLVTIAEKI